MLKGCNSSSTVGAEGDDAPDAGKTRLEDDGDAIHMRTREEHADDPTVELDSAEVTCVENQLGTWLNDAHAVLDERVPDGNLIWEVSVDEGMVSVLLAHHGVRWRRVTQATHRWACLDAQRREKPEEVWMAPPCSWLSVM